MSVRPEDARPTRQAKPPAESDARDAYQRGFEDGWRQALETMGKDSLTGVKSKAAYGAEEQRMDEAMASGGLPPFALVVCDVNELKQANDTRGHAAGDALLKQACSIICDVFKHSPVYRFGGDEFVALLRSSDYDTRAALMAQLRDRRHCEDGRQSPLFACGIADWDPTTDRSVSDVFRRADAAMYQDKRRYRA